MIAQVIQNAMITEKNIVTSRLNPVNAINHHATHPIRSVSNVTMTFTCVCWSQQHIFSNDYLTGWNQINRQHKKISLNIKRKCLFTNLDKLIPALFEMMMTILCFSLFNYFSLNRSSYFQIIRIQMFIAKNFHPVPFIYIYMYNYLYKYWWYLLLYMFIFLSSCFEAL